MTPHTPAETDAAVPAREQVHWPSKEVFVAIRHTRSMDIRLGVYDDEDEAHHVAQQAVREAVMDYGHGSASVYAATLTLRGRPLPGRD